VMALKERWDKAHPATPLVHCGLKALGSLRMEKAYRDFGHDMDNLDTLVEVGLGFTADMQKPGGFVGKECVAAQQKELREHKGLRRRLCQVLITDPEPMLYHGEVVRRNGVVCGDVRVGSYGHTLGGSVGLAMIEAVGDDARVNKAYLDDAVWEVEIAGKLHPAVVSLQPMYDPKNARIKA
jgi:glycine cleavage system aminomethyltransferase T